MASRPLKREYMQGYPNASRQNLPWGVQVNGPDDNEDDNFYDNSYDQRRTSVNDDGFATSAPYGSRPPVAAGLGAYSSYGYPAPATPHTSYTLNYAYGNQRDTAPYSQPYTTNEARSPTSYGSQFPDVEYATSYSSTHATTPAITYTLAPATITTTSDDYWGTPQHARRSYGSSDNHSPVVHAPAHGLVRTRSQRSDGNRSQTSNDGKDRRFICNRYIGDETECSAAFVRKADLTRHIECVHDKTPQFSCPVRNCSRKGDQGFTRRDHRTEHLRHFHHRDIPKRNRGNQQMDEEDDDDVPPF